MTGIIDTSQYQYVVFLILAILTAPAIAAAAFSAARNRGGIEAQRLAAFLATGLGYLLSNMLELLAPSEGATLFFARFTYLFVTASPVLGLRFALAITGRNKAANSKPLALLLFIIPATTVILVFTGAGSLVWSSYRFNRALGLPIVYASYGPWFYVHMAYTYLLILASAVIIGLDFAPRHGAFRRQSAWMATGIVIPIAVSALYAFRAIPGLTKDFTPIGIGLSGLAFWLGMRREGLLDLMPVAYSSLVSGLRDPLVVADRKGRIVALNPAAAALPGLGPDAVGREAAAIEGLGLPEGATRHSGEWEYDLPPLGPDGLVFQLRAFPLVSDDGLDLGRVFAFHDVTARERLLAEKEALIDKLSAASHEIGELQGIIPICASCKRIRDDEGYWRQVEDYLSIHASVDFTHGLCPECLAKYAHHSAEAPGHEDLRVASDGQKQGSGSPEDTKNAPPPKG
jgi:PAS domain-containing protein